VQGPTEDAFGDWLSVKFKDNKDNMDCAISDLSRAPPRALPGGFALGEMVFFVGSAQRQSTMDDEHATYGGRGLGLGSGSGSGLGLGLGLGLRLRLG
jgi:hypothetical protein